mgnify:CR=1 FL=1
MATQKNSTPDIPEARRDMTPNKGGRPKKAEEEKKKGVSVYLKGRPLSQYAHHQTVYGKVVDAIPQDLGDALKDCSGMSNNLNQITMQINAAFKDTTDKRIQKLVQLAPQLEYQSQMIGQILIYIAGLCSQR